MMMSSTLQNIKCFTHKLEISTINLSKSVMNENKYFLYKMLNRENKFQQYGLSQ
ncbi:unnamed protein product [Paramecium pentaurelia]|uniref:Uncharacterized protein n=1 Tax=Paramecium pentaurelia TaxID=43138 RepID=A0A8S1SRN7_9CILI|nr:unnamed protein product [Paramecium pentaurelia]